MERTGHRSIEGVRSYKRTSETQREVLSDILNRKVPRVGDAITAPSSTTPAPHIVSTSDQASVLNAAPPLTAVTSTAPSPLPIIQALAQNSQMKGLSFPSATFNSCTFNFNMGSASQ